MTDNTQNNIYGAKTWVVHPYAKSPKRRVDTPQRTPEERLAEAVSLCDAIALDVVAEQLIPLQRIQSGMYIGKGAAEQLASHIADEQIELCVFDCTLSPIQQRELEKVLQCKVIDRTALILEIFGERAATREGVLQVQLAALTYQKSRLVRSWTHLERQRGGGGFMGGPGERQIESDRRAIDDDIIKIKRKLANVSKTRELHRKNRERVPYPVVALVGYTNAGKSTLFNRLIGANVYADDLLFATLDPTMRELTLPSGRRVILSDTVGFISELPTELIAAFRATLEEVTGADLILHVRDIASADSDVQRADVIEVLNGLDLPENWQEDCVELWNKIDLLESPDAKRLRFSQDRSSQSISAVTGAGTKELLRKIDDFFDQFGQVIDVTLPVSDGKKLAWLHANGQYVYTDYEGETVHITARLSPTHLAQWQKQHKSS